MRENRVLAAELRLAPLLIKLSLVAACLAACASGCAVQVDTLRPGDETVAGDGGTNPVITTGGKSSSGGSGSAMAGASGGQVVNAFGGTGSSGGKASGGAGSGGIAGSGGAAGAGGKAQGGSGGTAQAGSGGNKNGGAGGQAGSGGKPSGGTGSGGAGSLTCLASWKNDKCDSCSSQTQSDYLGCVQILDCYYQNSCGPATCGGNADKCGANNIGKGTAGYPIASDVYTCLCK
jgi:hypothetical protein